MRTLGIDLGRRRIGLAISDPSATLARPLETLVVGTGRWPDCAIACVAPAVSALAAEDDGLAAIVVGVPVRLDGGANDETARASAFIEALRRQTVIPVVSEGERLTSHEAESRLARGERDWRERKKKLDAEAAAIILQDYLDRRTTHA